MNPSVRNKSSLTNDTKTNRLRINEHNRFYIFLPQYSLRDFTNFKLNILHMIRAYGGNRKCVPERSADMECITEILDKKIEMLESLKNNVCEKLINSPEGYLRVTKTSKKKEGYQYYHCTHETGKCGKYIRKADRELARKLAQKEYDERIFEEAERTLCILEEFKNCYDEEALFEIYRDFSNKKREMIVPRVLTDEQYAENWQQQTYEKKPFAEGTPEIYSERGERVRSKSEKMIADKLFFKNIPYKYEAPILLNGRIVNPDFTVLNSRTREEYLWEHFGMMDNADYAEAALWKIDQYQKEGIMPGRKLIITHETSRRPLTSPVLEHVIDTYFK